MNSMNKKDEQIIYHINNLYQELIEELKMVKKQQY